MARLLRLGSATALVLLLACGDYGGVTFAPDGGAGDPGIVGRAVGQSCDDAQRCRVGLACTAGTCAPGHALAEGAPCVIGAECKEGLYCGPARTCAPAGQGADAAACKSDADCRSGLRCSVVGLSLQCRAEGTADVGGACKTSGDCFSGLACVNKQCAPLPPTPSGPPPLGLPTWRGAECKDEPGATRAYFRVPRGTGDGDFYRLPFPNDARMKNGHPDLSGHPTPGDELLGFDVVDRYLRDIERTADGFSAYGTVFFRFSAPVDFDSLKREGAIKLVDVTAGQPAAEGPFYWEATTGRNAYLCENSLRLRPPLGAPFEPGHTYTVLVGTQVVDAKGQPITRSPDLDALLAAAPPGDAALSAAYAAYKPLRDYLAASGRSPSSILTATVFTVGASRRTVQKIPAAVAVADPPTASGWVKCGGGTPSPCPQAEGDRACGATAAEFDELHALVKVPVFQKGAAPYATPDDGGDLELLADGTPKVQRTEDVCMSLTIPKGAAMPAAGWPLVVYAHGTGGSFRSHVLDGTAARLAAASDGAGGTVRMAVLGIDQVQHGPRRGVSKASPNDLFFNFVNPQAARGNPLQGAADQATLVRFARSLSLPAGTSPTGAAVQFGAVAFWGHSQGATEGGIVMPYLPVTDVRGVVLSGQGASLLDSLRTKTSPVDVSAALQFVLVDADAKSEFHPVLSLLQLAIEPADPLSHAAVFVKRPIQAADAKHVFQPFGMGDTYSPERTQQVFAVAAGLGVATPGPGVAGGPLGGVTALPVPVSGNVSVGGRGVTAVLRQYAPDGYDGHFVAFRQATARKDVDLFLSDLVSGRVPRVGL